MLQEIPDLKFKKNLKNRICATLLDYGFFLLLISAYIIFFGHDNEEGRKTVEGLQVMPIPVLWLIYFVSVEANYGATLGHQAFNLKVLTADRKRVGMTEALKRHFMDPIDIFIYGIPAIITINNSERHQRLGDIWARTIVVNVKDPEQFP